MSIQSTVESGRRMALSMLIDRGVITRGVSAPVFDPITGELSTPTGDVVYEGPCRIKTPSAVERNVIFGDTQVTKSRFIAMFRWDIPDVEIGNIVTVTESDDPHITTRSFRVVMVPSSSVLTHRKLGVEAVE